VKATKTAVKKSAAPKASSKGFSAEERAAMKERAQELKAEAEGANGEKAVLEKLATMSKEDRALGERIHAIVRKNAPKLVPRLWYGMPAYARDGKVVVFFQESGKFKARYSTLGFSDLAKLDDGAMWPNSYAITKLTAADEARIAELVKKSVG
jgi:uncharacterized protein YdhG (YjbR/CyaY superfamily)